MISLHLMHSHYSKRPTSLDFHFHLEFQMPYEQEKATLNADSCILNKSLSLVQTLILNDRKGRKYFFHCNWESVFSNGWPFLITLLDCGNTHYLL